MLRFFPVKLQQRDRVFSLPERLLIDGQCIWELLLYQDTGYKVSIVSSCPDPENERLSQEALAEAGELSRGAEVLPDGARALARRIQTARQEGRVLRAKLGIDPTSADLHLGHAVVFRKLRQFQEFGHQVVIIVGGFTAQIGDPSGRNSTRPSLDAAEVEENARTYLAQMGKVLDLEKVELTNNTDWLANLTLADAIKLAGFTTANQLLAKEAFGGRLEKQLAVGFHELFYPLLQAYDSVAVRADIELGGTDQRFNILQGREIQPHYGQAAQLALLVPLLVGTDGVQKMSKSYGNYIGLTEAPDVMFGKCMRISDNLICKYLELATTMDIAEIADISSALATGSNPKDAKENLAYQVVELYHGSRAAHAALENWRRVHSQRLLPEDMPSYVLEKECPLFRLIRETGMAVSSAEAKRLVSEGAVRVDGEPVTDPLQPIKSPPEAGSVLQVGRRKFVRLLPG